MHATYHLPVAEQAPKTYSLNQGQKAAADAFFDFLFSEEKAFNLSGAAGVGKTFWMGYIIDIILPRYAETCKLLDIPPEYDSVVMTATTNKAAEVLGSNTKRPTQTVHSYFNLKVKENYSTGTQELKKTDRWRVHDRQIIFIDECSMIDTELWKVLLEGTHKCKLVFVGDKNQLAPIHEKISPIYNQNYPLFELLEPMRNAGQPALMDICQQLRETVETGKFNPIQIVPGVIDWLDADGMVNEIGKHFATQTHEARILAYTNKRVIEFNDYIRDLRGLPTEYQEGEFLVNNSTFQFANKSVAVETEVTIMKNHGHSQIDIGHDGVKLDINLLDFKTDMGGYYTNIPYPINRTHYNELIKYYQKLKEWSVYFRLKNDFIDLRPRDAATVHKSQGSTYDTVFVDLGNISTCNIQNQVARMLYVAFSRARNRVFLYGNLADKYGGLILP